ncbi:DNA methyltransferase [Shigella phage vB_SflS-ISF001]|uniref:DNA adenine methyltransferase n=1 Tax=Shigella phage vB_SflS-ISF001 TaxID=2048005 RepID=A0A2D1GQ49_9CAUD|nr:DNA methyltransferase [Shigella phage vB_SflS-ISF001]ATN94088.1 DNA adenine methyltransferase [Shigella phage vB_SflS-ISF001]
MIDFNDIETIDYAETACSFTREAIASDGYYQAQKTPTCKEILGRRYKGTSTPDAVRVLWSTPREVIVYLEGPYGKYDLDAAASVENIVCEKFYSQETNCLIPWWGKNKHVWLNPPYIQPDTFVKKAIEQKERNNRIDILLPADNSTGWYTEVRQHAAEIIWIEADLTEAIDGNEYARSGRLAFTSAETGKAVVGNNKGSVIFNKRELKEGVVQQTHYIPSTSICRSVKNKRAKVRKE